MAYTTTWARGAIAAAAISCRGVMAAVTAAADPPDFDLSHHAAPALAPGVRIGIYNADGNPVDLHGRMARPRQHRSTRPAHRRTLRRWRRRHLLQQDHRFPNCRAVHPPGL